MSGTRLTARGERPSGHRHRGQAQPLHVIPEQHSLNTCGSYPGGENGGSLELNSNIPAAFRPLACAQLRSRPFCLGLHPLYVPVKGLNLFA